MLVAKAPPIQPVHWPPPTTTHAFGMCDMLSPPRGGWSSCTLERVKSLPHSQLIDYSCLHKQIDLLPTQKSTLLLGRPDESERAPPKQPTGGGAESRCRAENKRVHISAGAWLGRDFTGGRGRYGPEPWVSCPGLFPIPPWGEVTLHPPVSRGKRTPKCHIWRPVPWTSHRATFLFLIGALGNVLPY